MLWVVARAAGGHLGREAATSLLKKEGLWDAASPGERSFLLDQSPDFQTANGFVWRLEALVALLWVLGEIESLPWPGGQCDVKDLSRIMAGDLATHPIADAPTPRPVTEILDAQQLTMMQHWAAWDQMRTGGMPADLNFHFKRPGAFPWQETRMNMGVVAERHYF